MKSKLLEMENSNDVTDVCARQMFLWDITYAESSIDMCVRVLRVGGLQRKFDLPQDFCTVLYSAVMYM